MAAPIWKNIAGKLATIEERVFYSLQLEAEDADSTTLIYSKIAGTLPPGIELTTAGELRGVPFEVAARSLYNFVVRVSDGTNIADRTFNIQVVGANAPVFSTPIGELDLSDSTRVGNRWVLDGSYIEYQIVATDRDTAAGQMLVYDIVGGILPPGVTMSKSGLISGTILLTNDERYGPIGGYDNSRATGLQPNNISSWDVQYDPTAYSKSRSKNFEFTVRVSDGSSSVTQNNSIFVYTADFWRVDNNRITVDETEYDGYPLVMSLSANRRPVFQTAANLGTFRHDNQCVIKIDVVDFDPLQGDLEYSIVSGALPAGLSIDINSGEISGQLPTQAAVESQYTFTVRAARTPVAGATVYTDKTFTMTVIGEIDVGIAFTTSADLGILNVGIPSLFAIEAVTAQANRVLNYSITAGSLPAGLSLSPEGNIIGQMELTEFFTMDDNFTTFDNNIMSIDRKYFFTVTVSDQYQSAAASKQFAITIRLPYAKQYGNMIARGFLSNKVNSVPDADIFYSIAQDSNINNKDLIFRSEDSAFGIKSSAEMLLIAGLEYQTLTTLQYAMEQNHEPKTLYFGDIKTAVARENGVTKYEVVYIEMKDNLVNNDSESVSKSITLRKDINKPLLGPVADVSRITADHNDDYTITTDGGLSFSISGSKIRYASPLSADLGTFEKLFPNAVANMRSEMKALGQKEYVHMPLWMRTPQDNSGVPLGYKMAIVLAYCKPSQSGLVRRKILNKNIDFKKINFKIDRYIVNASRVGTGIIFPDGSTKTFTLNEIVHEEDIKIREDATVLKYGDQITSDNVNSPTYISADTLIRSADYEPAFYLTHDPITKKTTINFNQAPAANVKIRVQRQGDKYLAFRRKLKE
jgi:hypothetical protein